MVLHVAWVGTALLLQQANKLRLNFVLFETPTLLLFFDTISDNNNT